MEVIKLDIEGAGRLSADLKQLRRLLQRNNIVAKVAHDVRNIIVERTFRGISAELQQKIAGSTVLVAGCGSTGGSTVELLVRTGFTHLLLADNGSYEVNNANRQKMTLADDGRMKVDVFREICAAINPYVSVETWSSGITAENVEELVTRADIIIDGVDVTTTSGLKAKYELQVSLACS